MDLSGYNMLPIGNSYEDLAASVEQDVHRLRASPLISPGVAAYGYVYDTQVLISPCPQIACIVVLTPMSTRQLCL